MWEDFTPLEYINDNYDCDSCQEIREWAHVLRRKLTFDERTFDILIEEMSAVGINMLVLDLGDAVKYHTHPEIAVEGAWSPARLREKLKKIRSVGIEPIPKLNFATTHDIWMKDYSKMVSTDIYYGVCKDLINEVIDIFDTPRFFHIGMDEETYQHQRKYEYVVVRQNDLWWKDLLFYIKEVESRGVRPWMWSDYAWSNPELFFEKMPKSVLQSNWHYGNIYENNKVVDERPVNLYMDLEENGFDQIPTGSNYSTDTNMRQTVEHCSEIIHPSRLYGFLIAPWRPTLPQCIDKHKSAISQLHKALL
jgi:hypothetical protein